MAVEKELFSSYSRKVILMNLLGAHSRVCNTGSCEDIIKLTSFCKKEMETAEFEVEAPIFSTEVIHYFDGMDTPKSSEFLTRSAGRIGRGSGK